MVELRPAENLHDAWEIIQDGVAVCLESEDQDARKEDVYVALKTGVSFVYYVFKDDQYKGFTILTPGQDPYSGERFLHIWQAYVPGMNVFEDGEKEVTKIAKSMGATKITTSVARESLGKKLSSIGYELKQLHYIKRL